MKIKEILQKYIIPWCCFIVSGAAYMLPYLVHESWTGWILVVVFIACACLAIREFSDILEKIPANIWSKDVTMALVIITVSAVAPLVLLWLQGFWWRAVLCSIIAIIAIGLLVHFNQENEN